MIKRRKEPRRKAPWVLMRDAEEAEKPKRIRKVSDRQRKRLAEYGKVKSEFLTGLDRCERCCCVVKELELHHKRGRAGRLLCASEFFAALCSRCHRWVHDNPGSARATGWIEDWGKQN